jgi:LPS-assembly protein
VDGRRSEETGDVDVAGLSLQYRPGPRRLIGAGYRFREETLEQTDFTVLWPLGSRWHAIARHNYSLHDRRALETMAGVEYRSCCWRARLVRRRHLEDVTGDEAEYKRSIYLQVEFIGLASLGDDLESLLERGILGY